MASPGLLILNRLILHLMEIRWEEVSTKSYCFNSLCAPWRDLSRCHGYGLGVAGALPRVPLQPLALWDGSPGATTSDHPTPHAKAESCPGAAAAGHIGGFGQLR